MINGIISVVVIMIISSVGFIFTYKKLWPEVTPDVLSTIVVKIAAPCLAVISIYDRLTPEMIKDSWILLLIALMHVGSMYILGKILSRLQKLKSEKQTAFEVSFTFSNVIFIGLPINEIVFGQAGMPFLFAYYVISLSIFWSLGAFEISRKSSIHPAKFTWKKIINPSLIGIVIGVIFVETGLSIPGLLETCLRYMNSLCVPLSLLVIGSNIVSFSKDLKKISLSEIIMIIGKFCISPLIMFGFLTLFDVSGMAFKVLMLTSTMPCHMQTSILAQYYSVGNKEASRYVSITTLCCFITIPIYVYVLV